MRLPEVTNDFVEGNAAEYANNETSEKIKHDSFLTGWVAVLLVSPVILPEC